MAKMFFFVCFFLMNTKNLLIPCLNHQFSSLHCETLIPQRLQLSLPLVLSRLQRNINKDWYCNQQQMSAGESWWHICLWVIPHPACAVSSTTGHTTKRSYITTTDVRKSQEWGSTQPRMSHCSERVEDSLFCVLGRPDLKCLKVNQDEVSGNLGKENWMIELPVKDRFQRCCKRCHYLWWLFPKLSYSRSQSSVNVMYFFIVLCISDVQFSAALVGQAF